MEMMEVSMGGNVVMKQAFDGATGYQSQMSNKADMDAEEIARKKWVM